MDMSIATTLEALQQAKVDIADAITAKGGTVGDGDGYADFAEDIGTIQGGGGGLQWNTISGTTIGSTNLTFSGVDLTNASVVIIDFVCRDKTGGATNIFAGTVRLFGNSMISSDLLQALTEKTTASGTEYIHNINSKEMTAFSRFMLYGYGGGNAYGNAPTTITITSDTINIKLSYQLLSQSIYDVSIKWL